MQGDPKMWAIAGRYSALGLELAIRSLFEAPSVAQLAEGLNQAPAAKLPLQSGDKLFFYTDWAYRSSINYFLYEAKEFKGRPLTETWSYTWHTPAPAAPPSK